MPVIKLDDEAETKVPEYGFLHLLGGLIVGLGIGGIVLALVCGGFAFFHSTNGPSTSAIATAVGPLVTGVIMSIVGGVVLMLRDVARNSFRNSARN